jgi:hypothetical protein
MSDIFILDEEKKQKKSNKVQNDLSLMDKINAYLLSKQTLTVKDKVIFFRLLSTMINA